MPVYTVKVRPGRLGFVASVGRRTRYVHDGMEWWMGWDPEPTYWRPTLRWAVARAARKRRALVRADAREQAVVTVGFEVPRPASFAAWTRDEKGRLLIDGELVPGQE